MAGQFLDLTGLARFNENLNKRLTTTLKDFAKKDEIGQVSSGLPVGFEYFQTNPVIRAGSLPLTGGLYSRKIYKDLWEWVQTQSGYLISEAEWQVKSKTSNGAVPFYSDGDGSTTFRVPALTVWVKGQGANEAIGDYLADSFKSHKHNVTAKSSSAGAHNHTATSSEVADHTHTGSTGSAGGVTPKATLAEAGGHGHTASTDNVGGHTHTRGTMNITGKRRLSWSDDSASGIIMDSGGNVANSALYGTHEGTVWYPATKSTSTQAHHLNVMSFDASRSWTGATSNSGSHTHTVTVNTTGAHTHTLSVEPIPAHTHSVSINNAGRHTHKIDVTSSVDHTHTVTVTETEQGSSETKPRTIVGVYCVIAFGTVINSGSVNLEAIQQTLLETQKIIIDFRNELDLHKIDVPRDRETSKPTYGIEGIDVNNLINLKGTGAIRNRDASKPSYGIL